MKNQQQPSVFTNLILNKDQTLIHELIKLLSPKDLRNLRSVSKTIEEILISNTNFTLKAMWSPLIEFATGCDNFYRLHRSDQCKSFIRRMVPQNLGERRYWRAFRQCTPVMRLKGGLATILTTLVITKLDDGKERYEFIKRKIFDNIRFEEKAKMIIHNNGFKSPDLVLTELETTNQLVQKALLETSQIAQRNQDTIILGTLTTWHGEETIVTLADLLNSLKGGIEYQMWTVENCINRQDKDDFDYVREPIGSRFVATYCTNYMNNLMADIVQLLEINTKQEETNSNANREQEIKNIDENCRKYFEASKYTDL